MHGYTHHGCAYCDAEFGVDEWDERYEALAYNPTARLLIEFEVTDADGPTVRRVPDNGTSKGACVQYKEPAEAADAYLRWFRVGEGWTHPAGGAL